MAKNLEQEGARKAAVEGWPELLGRLDSSFGDLQEQVQELIDLRQEVAANTEGTYNLPEDLDLVDARLGPRRTVIKNWAAGIPGGP